MVTQLLIKKGNQSRYRPEQAQKLDRCIALPFRDLGARRGCVVSIMRWLIHPGKEPVPILKDAGWVPGPIWTCAKKSRPHREFFPTKMTYFILAFHHSKIEVHKYTRRNVL
jgi:hypothetical protein